jgi:aspartate-semialdehyde dehydrogenase
MGTKQKLSTARDLNNPSGRSLALFAASEQLLKGAALNAVQIAKH